ncbi:hypothetical protein LTR17_010541 [Elasticomyces elasticus]|nr:hypothetical protein LTR17_010541 [Elasticomyces elasticus]
MAGRVQLCWQCIHDFERSDDDIVTAETQAHDGTISRSSVHIRAVIAVDEAECMNQACVAASAAISTLTQSSDEEDSENDSNAPSDSDTIPVSRSCYYWLKKHLRKKDEDGYLISAWPEMEPRLRIVDNQQTCGNPWCPDKPDIVDHSDQASHFSNSDSNPTLCDCVHPKKHALHTKILLHINRLETLSDELILAYDVTGSMSNKSKGLKKIGLGVPLGDQTSELGALSLMVMDLRIDGKR